MPSYSYILIGQLLLPWDATFSFLNEPEGPVVMIHARNLPGGQAVIGGESARALVAFSQGTLTFPVNSNGVLDIAKGWRDAEATRQFVDDGTLYKQYVVAAPPVSITVSPLVADVMFQSTPPPDGLSAGRPRLDISKIKEKVLGGLVS